MANRKISDLTALTAPVTGDLLPIVDISEAAAADKNKKITFGVFVASALSTAGIVVDGSGNVNIDSNTLYVDAVNNRVGIGTTSPGAILDVKVASDAKLLAQDGNTTGNIKLNAVNNAVSANVNLEISASNTQFFNGGSERARIDSSGRLLVGTSSARSNFYNGTNDAAQVQLEGTDYKTGSFSLTCNSTTAAQRSILSLNKSSGSAVGSNTLVGSTDYLGEILFQGNDGTNFVEGARIRAEVDGTPGTDDMPGRLVFSTTADGAASPTERLRITSAGALQVADAGHITVGTTTGTKIGTATTQKLGFYNATPVVQPTAVADATTAVDVITQLNALLAKLRTLGIIAT